jgi:hypothetical protein
MHKEETPPFHQRFRFMARQAAIVDRRLAGAYSLTVYAAACFSMPCRASAGRWVVERGSKPRRRSAGPSKTLRRRISGAPNQTC